MHSGSALSLKHLTICSRRHSEVFLPLIQEGLLSEFLLKECAQALVHCLEANPVQEKVWLGKLTMFDTILTG